MKRITREQKLSILGIIGRHIEKHRVLVMIALGFFILTLVGFVIYWFFDNYDINSFIDGFYLSSQIAMGVISLGILGVLFLNQYKKIDAVKVAITMHVYAFLIMLWAIAMCIIDLKLELSPFIYLIVATAISSLFVLEPFYFSFLAVLAYVTIIVCNAIGNYKFFNDISPIENIFNLSIYTVLIIVISFRHYNVTMREYKAVTKIEEMTYNDELTGLKNERSYLNIIDDINNCISKGDIEPFAVVLMDVNNLKATNDAYGHRYGCHLIVRTGHTLPDVFKTSFLFHVGGDEFIAVVIGEDYNNFDQTMELFDKTFRYSLIQYEGQELAFSVARGYAKYEKGNLYKDVLQKADDMMYKNKAEIKETYHLKSR